MLQLAPYFSRRKRKSTILTDTPEKEALRIEYEDKMKKKQKKEAKDKVKGKGKGKGKGKSNEKNKHEEEKVEKVKKRVLCSESESEPEEWYCLVCTEAYSNSGKGDWVQCIICKMWAHVGCVTGDIISFVCINCDSDED